MSFTYGLIGLAKFVLKYAIRNLSVKNCQLQIEIRDSTFIFLTVLQEMDCVELLFWKS